jgi:hypothetical protein
MLKVREAAVRLLERLGYLLVLALRMNLRCLHWLATGKAHSPPTLCVIVVVIHLTPSQEGFKIRVVLLFRKDEPGIGYNLIFL